MKKILFSLTFGLFCLASVHGQEYKLSKSTGKLEISEVNDVSIEGYAGNEIVFTSRNHDAGRDARAKGLRAISGLGFEDNTGLGLSVVEKGDVIEVRQLRKTDGPEIKIRVPKGVVISYVHTSPYGESVEIRDFAGEVQISTVHNGVELTNASGPLSIKTVHGDIDASFAGTLSAPIALESVHGHVDVALPVATKANLTLTTNWGEVLVDPDFKIEIERSGDLVNYSSKLRGKLNAGGTEIKLTAHHDNVYLRKK